MPTWNSTDDKAQVSSLIGCGLKCPPGTSRADFERTLSVLDEAPIEVLGPVNFEETTYPRFFTEDIPMEAPVSLQCDPMETTYTIDFPESPAIYPCRDSKPTNFAITDDSSCGPQSFNFEGATSGGLLCEDRIGPNGIATKTHSGGTEFFSSYGFGPICLDKFWRTKRTDELIAFFMSYMNTVPYASEYNLSKLTINELISMSHHNSVAVAGRPDSYHNWTKGGFQEMPTSAGTLEWLLSAAEDIATYTTGNEIVINISGTLLDYYINQYAVDKGIQVTADLGMLRRQVRSSLDQVAESDEFSFRLRRNGTKTLKLKVNRSAIFVELMEDGSSRVVYKYQDTRVFEDNGYGGAYGRANANYGKPCYVCPKSGKVIETYEIIPIIGSKAFSFHHFNRNPLAEKLSKYGKIDAHVWPRISSGELRLWTGTEAALIANTMSDCMVSNKDNQLLVGEYRKGRTIREGRGSNGLGYGFLMVKLPGHCDSLPKSMCCLPACPKIDPITIVPKDIADITPCVENPPVIPRDCCIKTPSVSQILPPKVGEENAVVTVWVERTCADEQQSVSYAFTDETAINGTHYVGVDGSLVFEPGVLRQSFTYEVLPTAEGAEPTALTAMIEWSGEALCEEAPTVILIKPCIPKADTEEPCCPTEETPAEPAP